MPFFRQTRDACFVSYQRTVNVINFLFQWRFFSSSRLRMNYFYSWGGDSLSLLSVFVNQNA